MIYSTNADDVVASINDAGLEFLGLSDRFEVVGRPFSDHLLSAESRRFFLESLRKKGFITDYECLLRRAAPPSSGSRRPVPPGTGTASSWRSRAS